MAVPPRPDGGRYDRARLLVRRGSSVLGFVAVPVTDGGVPAAVLERAVTDLRADDPGTEAVAAGGDRPGQVSVIVCTYDRPAGLSRTLASILKVDWDEFEVVVVDNAPDKPGTRAAVQELGDPRLRYVPEPVPGLSAARNRGVASSEGEIVAFTDDDVIVDPGWLRALAAGFERGPRVACVTGLVPAGELDTAYQAYFDDKVKWSETLRPRLYDLNDNRGPSPLYPYANGDVGAGANFAVRRSVFESVGDFDEALGAGSPAEGGEDLDFFARLLLAGCQIAFEPGAIVWHEHRRDRGALRSQMHGYGAGLTAYACKHLLFGRAAPAVLAALAAGRGNGPHVQELPPISAEIPEMRIAELRGMLAGPWAYIRGRRDVRARTAKGR
jgi:GT2 family glycosyltransferase